MKTSFILFLLSLNICLYSQNSIIFNEPLKIVAIDDINDEIKKGTVLNAFEVSNGLLVNKNNQKNIEVLLKDLNGKILIVDFLSLKLFEFKEIDNIDKVWDKILLNNGTYSNLINKGLQYQFRQELNDNALEYLNILNKHERFFNDKYFEDYLYTLINKIHNGILKDKRPGNIYIKILKDTEPNAFVLPNGCVVVSTGLLSTIQSEDELVGILAHEIAHFVSDHFVVNFNKEIETTKKTTSWATFATSIAAATDVFLSIKNKNHLPGVLTTTTAILTSVISDEVRSNLGIKFRQEQELDADISAKEILKTLKYNEMGLSVALQRIKNYCIITGNYLALSGTGTHPSISVRISTLGKVNKLESFTQIDFLKKASLINSYNAWLELWYFSHHIAANDLVNRNIASGVATESDYIVKAIVKRRLSNTKESNEEVLNLLNTAKNLNADPLIILNRELGITYIRLNKKVEAEKAFQSYLTILNNLADRNDEIEEEISWTKKMIFKVKNL